MTKRAKPARPFAMFEVSVEGYGATVTSARSRSAAVYDRFIDFSDAFSDCTFRDFLRIATARRAAPRVLAIDPYEYIRSYYGIDLRCGTRVAITGEGRDLEGRAGTVVHPGRDSTQYARVQLDGDRHAINVHPKSLTL